jgi:hypothetical protein
METEEGDGKSCALLVRAICLLVRAYLFACPHRRLLCIWFQWALVGLGFADAIVASQPAVIHSVMTTWHCDGYFLRTATQEQYQQAFGGSTVSICVFGYVHRLLAEENDEPSSKV